MNREHKYKDKDKDEYKDNDKDAERITEPSCPQSPQPLARSQTHLTQKKIPLEKILNGKKLGSGTICPCFLVVQSEMSTVVR